MRLRIPVSAGIQATYQPSITFDSQLAVIWQEMIHSPFIQDKNINGIGMITNSSFLLKRLHAHSPWESLLSVTQCLIQIFNQIVDMFDPYAQSNRGVLQPGSQPFLPRNGSVGHGRRVTNE